MKRHIKTEHWPMSHYSILCDHFKVKQMPVYCFAINEKFDSRSCIVNHEGVLKVVIIYGRNYHTPGVEELKPLTIPDYPIIKEIFEFEGHEFKIASHGYNYLIDGNKGYLIHDKEFARFAKK